MTETGEAGPANPVVFFDVALAGIVFWILSVSEGDIESIEQESRWGGWKWNYLPTWPRAPRRIFDNSAPARVGTPRGSLRATREANSTESYVPLGYAMQKISSILTCIDQRLHDPRWGLCQWRWHWLLHDLRHHQICRWKLFFNPWSWGPS